ncbi:MAG: hypothetical protein LH603_08120 [Pseudonocardia sp.]|nr:hypothetical protein [Pseudonocardia sp.]
MARRRPGSDSYPPSRRYPLGNPYDVTAADGAGSARALHVLTGAVLATGAAIAMSGTAAADIGDPDPTTFGSGDDPFSSGSPSWTTDDSPGTGDAPWSSSFDTADTLSLGSSDTDHTLAVGSFDDLRSAPLTVAVAAEPVPPPTGLEVRPMAPSVEVATAAQGPLLVATQTDGEQPAVAMDPVAEPAVMADVGFAQDVTLTPYEATAEDLASLGSLEDALATGPIGITDPAATAALDTLLAQPADAGATNTPDTTAPPTIGVSSNAPSVTMSVQGSGGLEDQPTGEDPADEDLSWLTTEENGDEVQATDGPPFPFEQRRLPSWALDENVLEYRDYGWGFPLRAMEFHEEAFRPTPSPWAGLIPPKTPEEIARDGQHSRRMERQTTSYQFGRDLSTVLGVPFQPTDPFLAALDALLTPGTAQEGGTSQGAPSAANQLFELWQNQFDRDIRFGEPTSPTGVSPEALNTYLCLAAVRCEGAPPEATIYAGASLAGLLGSTGEMTPEGVAEVLAAADRGLQDLDRANGIAAGFLPDARLASAGDARRDELIRLINEVAPNETVADLMASQFLPQAHAAGPDGTPHTGPLPGAPAELGVLGAGGNYLRAWRDGTIPPVELAVLEGTCQEMARAVCETGYRIPGSSAAPNEPASPQRQADLAELNTALNEYWSVWRTDPGSEASSLAWLNVEMSSQNLAISMREAANPAVPSTSEPAPAPAQPGEVAGLTSDAQTQVLDSLFRNLPTRSDGTPLTFPDFTAALLGPTRTSAQDQTFRIPDGQQPAAPGEDASELPEVSAGPVSSGEGATEVGETAEQPAQRPTGQGGGVVIAPELPRPEDPIGDMIAGGRPVPPVELPDRNAPDGGPVDPSEFDPNQVPDPAPVDPAGLGQETFPGRDEQLERILNPSGVPGLLTSPLGAEEAPAAENAGPGQRSPESGTVGSSATGAVAVPQAPTRYAPLPGGRRGVVVDEQRLTGTGNPRDTAGSVITVQDPQTGQRYVSVQPTRVANPDGTQTVFLPQLPGQRVGYNPTGQTAAVYQLPEGQTGRVTGSTPVNQLRVRTSPGTTLEFNGGGGPNAVPGMAYRDPVDDNPTQEQWTIFPASTINYDTGVRTYSAQVPAGYENQVDLAQRGIIRLRVPAGTRPAAVSRTVQAFTPYVPTPTPTYSAPTYSAPAYSAPAYTPPVSSPALQRAPQQSGPVATPRQNGVGQRIDNTLRQGGQLLDQAGRATRQLWNDQPLTVRDLPNGDAEVTFTDRRVGHYDRNGNRVGGSGPDWVSPLQTATPGRALDELGTILQNIPPLPIPGWNPGQQWGY